jgi:hypothetical protein
MAALELVRQGEALVEISDAKLSGGNGEEVK